MILEGNGFLRDVRLKILFVLLFLPGLLAAQIGGRHVYDFLNLSPAARSAALGGVNITTYDHETNLAFQNPALVNDSMHNQVSFSVAPYLADIVYGYTSYARSIEGVADFHTGIQYVSYGQMIQADALGNQTGNFSAGDFAWVVGASRQWDRFRGGVNLKLINSNIQGFRSYWGIGLDIGGLYVSPSKLFTAAIVFKNIGFNLSRYELTGGAGAPLPFQAQVGISHKLKYMPLRFSITATNLQQPDLIYTDPNTVVQVDLSGDTIVQKEPVIDNIFRHFVFGTEFILSRNFQLRAGYNHLRRQELRSTNRGGLSGFSFGVGIKVYRFRLDYGVAVFHAIGATHHITIASNLSSWGVK